ncbi:MAG: type II CRISPR-associated endonuclease Cas1 [Ureaplasma sp.]|nr:type II CRISPR-associated endonuclease Cas1 [Ureaplasma sp.]
MGWKIINIESPCIIKTLMSNLILLKENKIKIPMSDIDVLLISENRVNLSVNAINDLVKHGVCIILCNENKLPSSYILGYKIQKQSYDNFRIQLNWQDDFKKLTWNWLQSNKIKNQILYLEYLQIEHNNLNENNINELFEAKVASFFFKSLYGDKFKRTNDCIVNKLLNYGYTILTNMVARSIVKNGLHPMIAFFHGSVYSKMPLAYDIVEIFRIIIDIFVKSINDIGILENRVSLNSQLKNCLIDFIANYKIKINDSIDYVIDWIINKSFMHNKIDYDYEIEYDENLKNIL